ncbi:HAD-IA family hydrolase [Lachnoanaerobaculum sp. Marseille-Q4761]|uniref:HAD-IA family hydrolase n=1 Tax=Lachnoanaerobaculum sp. Marseille-Q4761 TaxID=2819511 RepID=UPI000F2C2DFC|nr:HAD-IA family hydrolase [Lachnoanaerobaculum sp. Marseille-Q4761]MBO1869711.1 HAD-IA family hydrolase [Lachnoanaerobaculum sp. Marseille-Q4761]RKW38076.1 MAG: HAD family hydrolase [Lachnospiraceae bacterium]
MKQKHILFDLDGTIVRSDPGITRGVQKSLEHFGIYEEPENLKKFVGPPLVESYTKLYGLSLLQYEKALEIFHEYYRSTGIFECELYEGIEEMLKVLSVEYRLYIATSKPEKEARRVIEHFGLDKYFTFVGGSDGDFNTKRSTKAAVIEYVLKSNNIEDKTAAIMVGDKVHDIVGANTVGLKSIGILYGYGSMEEFDKANYIVRNVDDLREMFIC